VWSQAAKVQFRVTDLCQVWEEASAQEQTSDRHPNKSAVSKDQSTYEAAYVNKGFGWCMCIFAVVVVFRS